VEAHYSKFKGTEMVVLFVEKNSFVLQNIKCIVMAQHERYSN